MEFNKKFKKNSERTTACNSPKKIKAITDNNPQNSQRMLMQGIIIIY